MLSLFSKKTESLEAPLMVTADELQFPDSHTLAYFNELLRGFVHKHNNFLTVTQGYTQLFALEQQSETTNENAETILASTEKAIELNSRIMACLANEAPKLEDLNIANYFENRCRNEKKNPKAHSLKVDDSLSKLKGEVRVDSVWLDIIFDEIFQNAYDAVQESPEAKIFLTIPTASPLANDPKDYLFVDIQDSGNGIPAEKIAHIFQPFFTNKGRNHVGIGLTRAGVLAVKIGVSIGITSSKKGTVTHLALPLVQKRVRI